MEKLLTVFTDSYLFCAVFGGTLLVIMFILTLIGFSHDAECDCEVHDGDIGEVSVLSVKGIIAFITFYGLSGLCFRFSSWGGWFVSVFCGIVMMFVTAGVITLVMKLQHSGNVDPESFVGCPGTVYLTLPGGGKQGGQVSVTLSCGTRIVAAVSEEALETGTPVVVEAALGNNVYKVSRQK